jgi:hypothetical protein
MPGSGTSVLANDLISTGAVSAVLFGLPVLASRMAESFRSAHSHNQPLA